MRCQPEAVLVSSSRTKATSASGSSGPNPPAGRQARGDQRSDVAAKSPDGESGRSSPFVCDDRLARNRQDSWPCCAAPQYLGSTPLTSYDGSQTLHGGNVRGARLANRRTE